MSHQVKGLKTKLIQIYHDFSLDKNVLIVNYALIGELMTNVIDISQQITFSSSKIHIIMLWKHKSF